MKSLIVGLLLLLLSCICSGCKESPRLPVLAFDAVVVAFGDSLTYGVGAKPETSYPAVLSRVIGRKVINAGVSGEETSGGLKRLPKILDTYRPNLVLLCLGGNDFIRRRSHKMIEQNLEGMLSLLRERSVPVVLIAVPDLGLPGFLADADIYQKLAEKYKIPIVKDELSRLESRNKFKSDTIHLNTAGYRLLAEKVAEVLKQAGALSS